MSAYVIGEIEVTNPDRYPEYTRLVPGSIAPYGGEFIARGGEVLGLEGEPPTGKRVVIIRFPSLEHVRRWWDSPEYQEAAAVRRQFSNGRIMVTEGVS